MSGKDNLWQLSILGRLLEMPAPFPLRVMCPNLQSASNWVSRDHRGSIIITGYDHGLLLPPYVLDMLITWSSRRIFSTFLPYRNPFRVNFTLPSHNCLVRQAVGESKEFTYYKKTVCSNYWASSNSRMEPEHLFRSFDFLLKNLSLSSLWGLHYVAGAQAPTATVIWILFH